MEEGTKWKKGGKAESKYKKNWQNNKKIKLYFTKTFTTFV